MTLIFVGRLARAGFCVCFGTMIIPDDTRVLCAECESGFNSHSRARYKTDKTQFAAYTTRVIFVCVTMKFDFTYNVHGLNAWIQQLRDCQAKTHRFPSTNRDDIAIFISKSRLRLPFRHSSTAQCKAC